MKKILILLYIMSLISCVKTQKGKEFVHESKLSIKVKKIVKDLISYGEITGKAIGFSGRKPKQWDNFMALSSNATEEELLLLTQHPNSVVKCYSFDLLVSRRNKNSFDILKNNITDTTTVYTQYGCIGSNLGVNDYFIQSITQPNPDKAYLTMSEKNMLDSLLLFTPNLISEYKDRLIEKIEVKPVFYNRLRQLAIEGSKPAVIAISKFQKEKDVVLINNLLENTDTDIQYYGLKAVKNFPNSSSFGIISKIHALELRKNGGFNYSMLKELYQAIVNFKDANSRALLEKTIHEAEGSTREYHFEFMWLALKKYPDKTYNGILGQLNYSEDDIYFLENKHGWLLD